MLHEEGVLRRIGFEWEACRVPDEVTTFKKYKEISAQYPAFEAELTLLHRCGEQLAEILRGECDPLQLLFPNGDLTSAENLYQKSPASYVFNRLVQKAVSVAIERLPKGRTVRILEIGAGTGGTTSYVLPHLPANQTEYVFSDVSHLFMSNAKEKFREFPFVKYQLLDIEQDIESQGFVPHQFDIILAANVIHATLDLHETLKHVQQLLAPEGMLMLLEATGPQRWLDLTFGLTEGWWRFADTDLRPTYPLLAPHQWQNLLQETGFVETMALPQPEVSSNNLSYQAVIIAQAPQVNKETEQLESISPVLEKSSWLIFADSKGVGQNLCYSLPWRVLRTIKFGAI
jgi:SAM-dependent methyltransferase